MRLFLLIPVAVFIASCGTSKNTLIEDIGYMSGKSVGSGYLDQEDISLFRELAQKLIKEESGKLPDSSLRDIYDFALLVAVWGDYSKANSIFNKFDFNNEKAVYIKKICLALEDEDAKIHSLTSEGILSELEKDRQEFFYNRPYSHTLRMELLLQYRVAYNISDRAELIAIASQHMEEVLGAYFKLESTTLENEAYILVIKSSLLEYLFDLSAFFKRQNIVDGKMLELCENISVLAENLKAEYPGIYYNYEKKLENHLPIQK